MAETDDVSPNKLGEAEFEIRTDAELHAFAAWKKTLSAKGAPGEYIWAVEQQFNEYMELLSSVFQREKRELTPAEIAELLPKNRWAEIVQKIANMMYARRHRNATASAAEEQKHSDAVANKLRGNNIQ